MVKHVDEGEGQDARAMIELEKLLGIGEGEGRDAQGMKELAELLGIVDAEKIKAGDVKKAPRGKELGKILARRLGKARPVNLERWLRQSGK